MRRWFFMAALGAALLGFPLWAQRGGHGGAAGGGVHVAPMGVPRGGVYGSRPPGHPVHFPNNPRGARIRIITSRSPWRWGYGWWGYPWASWGFLGGVGWWSNGSDASSAQSDAAYASTYPDSGIASAMIDQQREIDRLSEEVTRLRAERESGATGNAVQPPSPQVQVPAETVIVFRDHHTEQIDNYAIVGRTLWVFTAQRARKIPIAELDVPATVKANDAKGIDFQVPGQ